MLETMNGLMVLCPRTASFLKTINNFVSAAVHPAGPFRGAEGMRDGGATGDARDQEPAAWSLLS